MSARHKLNEASFWGSFIVSALAGAAFNSWLIFAGLFIASLIGCVHSGDIRLKPRRQ